MKRKILLGLFTTILCLNMIGAPNTGKVTAQQSAPTVQIDDPNPTNIIYTDSTSMPLDNSLCGNDTSLVACYQLDENTGSAFFDGIPNPFNDGTTVNGPTWVPGVYNSGLHFNGTTQYGYSPDEDSLDLTNSVTLAIWVKPENVATQDLIKKVLGSTGYELVLSAGTGSPSNYKAFVRLNGNDEYRVATSSNYCDNTVNCTVNTWKHIAATYDGTTIRIYFNGVLENSLPASITIGTNTAPMSVGAFYTGSSASRWYQGTMDDVRVYNRTLSDNEILALYSRPPIPSSPVPANGALVSLRIPDIHIHLYTTVNDLDTPSNLTVNFYGRQTCETYFTLVALPDTQNYSAGIRAPFDAQTSWIVNNANGQDWNIAYVTHLGDIVDTNSDTAQWDVAGKMTSIKGALSMLDGAGIPYGLALGNHDVLGGTTNFNTYFGISRFSGRPYYGGHAGSDNDNNYGLFSVGGVNFIVIHIESGADATTRSWANTLLQTPPYNTYRAIVITHNLLDGTVTPAPFSSEGQALYDALKDNPNLFLMLGGHATTEVRRTDEYPASSGHFIHSLRSDYQDRANGGNGWLRLYQFLPFSNQIQVKTYSPYLNQFEVDADSEFTLDYAMGGPSCEDNQFEQIGSVANVPSGSSLSIIWSNLSVGAHYQWYVTVNDGVNLVEGPIWEFTGDTPTDVRLANFTSLSLPQGIQLSWQTAQEIDLIGFNLYRSESQDGAQVQINPELIQALTPGQLQGNDYSFLDASAEVGKTYYYWVEWVGNRDTQLFGPLVELLVANHVYLPLGLK